MTIWFVPVDDAAAVLRVNSEVDGPMNVASERYSRRLDSLKDDIEVVLTHSKTVVNHGKWVGPFIKVDGQSIVHLYGGERRCARFRPGNPKQFGQ